MDRILLAGIELYAYGGVSAAERSLGQRYRIDVELMIDLARAEASDDLAHTIHYGHVYRLIVSVARERPFNLLESLAGRIAEGLLEHFPAQEVVVRVAKLLPPVDGVVASAAVELTRYRNAGAARGQPPL